MAIIRKNIANLRGIIRYHQSRLSEQVNRPAVGRTAKDPQNELIKIGAQLETLLEERRRLKEISQRKKDASLSLGITATLDTLPAEIPKEIACLKTRIKYYQTRIKLRAVDDASD